MMKDELEDERHGLETRPLPPPLFPLSPRHCAVPIFVVSTAFSKILCWYLLLYTFPLRVSKFMGFISGTVKAKSQGARREPHHNHHCSRLCILPGAQDLPAYRPSACRVTQCLLEQL